MRNSYASMKRNTMLLYNVLCDDGVCHLPRKNSNIISYRHARIKRGERRKTRI